MRRIWLAASFSLFTAAAVDAQTQAITLAWDPSPDAVTGRVLSYRVYVGPVQVLETGQLTAIFSVPRGVPVVITVSSWGKVLKDGVITEELGEGMKSAPLNYTAPPINMPDYLGCYSDLVNSVRGLPTQLMTTGATVDSCIAAAKKSGLRYAGVQWRQECFAGGVLQYEKRPDIECNLQCTAAPGQICGGSSRNSVYPTGLAPRAPSSGRLVK